MLIGEAFLSPLVTQANKHAMKSACDTIDSIVIDRPKEIKQNVCVGKGYDFPEIECAEGDTWIICPIRVKKVHRAKRSVLERTASWHNRFRKSLIRFEKKQENYLTQEEFANCLIV